MLGLILTLVVRVSVWRRVKYSRREVFVCWMWRTHLRRSGRCAPRCAV